MSIAIGDNLKSAFSYASDNTFKKFGRWIGMALLLMIPIAQLLPLGIFQKSLRDEELDFSNAGSSFLHGLQFILIAFIYELIPLIVLFVLGGGVTLLSAKFMGNNAGAVIGLAGTVGVVLLCSLLFIIFELIMIPAIVNFARSEKFSGAFKFSEIFAMIREAGVGKYILSFIVLSLISSLIGMVIGIIIMIPLLGWIVGILFAPFLMIVVFKFFGNLFEDHQSLDDSQGYDEPQSYEYSQD